MKLQLTVNGQPLEMDATWEGENLRVRLPNGAERVVQARRLPGGTVEITDGGRVFRVPVAGGERGSVSVAWDGQNYTAERAATGAGVRARKGVASGVVVATMTGVVTSVLVEAGERVAAYQPLVQLEAMKVLATITAPFAGTVRAVSVTQGKQVQQGAALVEVVPDAKGEGDG